MGWGCWGVYGVDLVGGGRVGGSLGMCWCVGSFMRRDMCVCVCRVCAVSVGVDVEGVLLPFRRAEGNAGTVLGVERYPEVRRATCGFPNFYLLVPRSWWAGPKP